MSIQKAHATLSQPIRRVAVVGGGVAGVAAATRLSEQGIAVDLYEMRRNFGGRAGSYVDPQSGQVLDAAQHIVMRCCHWLLDLYARLGTDHAIDWSRQFHFVTREGTYDTFMGDDLPAPLHLTRSMLAGSYLTSRDKLGIAWAMGAIMRTGMEGRQRYHGMSFGDWLKRHRQTTRAIERFWAPVVAGACNEWPGDCACDAAMQVFQEGFLATSDGYEMGVPTLPLARMIEPVEQLISKADGYVLLQSSVMKISCDESQRWSVDMAGQVEQRDQDGKYDAVIIALPFDRSAKLLQSSNLHHLLPEDCSETMTVSPIVGIHLWYDQPVTTLPHVAFLDEPLQWLFRCLHDEQTLQNQSNGRDSELHHYHGVISAAHDIARLPSEDIVAMCLEVIERALPKVGLPDAQGKNGSQKLARLVRSKVVKEHRATFGMKPGIQKLRVSQQTAKPGLFLAGDWTDTGWPATMEGACRSGTLAAHALLQQAGMKPFTLLPRRVNPSALYRMASLFAR